jgi:hypothetical protein
MWKELEKVTKKKILTITGGLNIGTKDSTVIESCL